MSLAKRKLEEENERFLTEEEFKIGNSRNKAESLQEINEENQKTGRKNYFKENTEAFNEDDAMLIHDKPVKCKRRIMSDTPFAIANDSSTLQILPDFRDNADDIAIAQDSLTNEGKYTDNEICENLSVDHQFIRSLGQTTSSSKIDILGQTARSPKIDFLGQTARSTKIDFLGQTARSPKIDFLGQIARPPKIDFLGQTARSPKIDFLEQTASSPKFDLLGQTASSPKIDFLGQTARSPKIDFLGQTARSPKIDFLGQTARSPKIDFLGQTARSPKIDFLGQTARSPKIDFLEQTASSPKFDLLGQTASSPKLDLLGKTASSPKFDLLGQTASSPKIDYLGQTARSPKIDFLGQNARSPKIDFYGQTARSPKIDSLGQTARSPKIDFLEQTASSPKIDLLGQTVRSPKIDLLGQTVRSPKINLLGQTARSPKIDFFGQTARSPKIVFLEQTASSPKCDFLGQTARSPKIDFFKQTARSLKIDFLGQTARSPKIDFLGQTASSPKIDFLVQEDPDQKAHFNEEIDEAKECDAEELCTDWCITEVKGNCHVLFSDVKSEVLQNFGDVKSEVLQNFSDVKSEVLLNLGDIKSEVLLNFVECDKVNDEINQLKVTEVDDNDSCDHRNTSTRDYSDYNFISNEVPCKLMQTKSNEYKIVHSSTGSFLKVEKLPNLESLSEAGGPAEILTSDLTPEKAEIVKNPSTSDTNEYIYNSCVLRHKEKGSREEQTDAYNFSCICLTPDAENIQNNISDNNVINKTNHTRMLLNHPVINDSEQICNRCVDGTITELQVQGSCKSMKYNDREEIEMDQKKNYVDLKECVKSWRTKYPWMTYKSSTFNCTLCIDYKSIFEVKNRTHIFKVASYLRQHESSSNHTRTMLNLTNNLLKYTIGFIKRTSFLQASKESLFLSLSEHLLLNEGTDSHECNEYIFSTVFKEFTTFLEQTELAFMNSNMTKSFSYILDECRQILIVRTISVSGHPEEILITKFLEETCKLSPVVKSNLSKAIFAKHVQCDRCDTCKETPLPDTNQTLPIRFPNISALTNVLQNDPAVIKYNEFSTISSKTVFFKGIIHWTNLELLNALISHFPQETKNFSYMKAILEIIQTLNNAYFIKRLIPLDVVKIDNLATPLKFVLNSTSLEFMELFVIELQNKCYHDGSSNVQYFEYIFNPFYIMTFDQNPTVYKLFLQIYLSIKKHLPVKRPEAMMNHLLMFCQYVVSDRNMASLQFSLCSILLLFQENLLLRQKFSVVHKFYELIALHPFLSASREISLYGVSASFSVLIKKYGRPLTYQIMKFLHSDDVLVHQFQKCRL